MKRLMSKKEFKNFYKDYAKNVDRFDEAYFWKLSDSIIKNILLKEIQKGQNLHILDAGGGTARWSIMLSEKIKAKYLVYDLSEDMLRVAKSNIIKANKKYLIRVKRGDLENMSDIKDNTFDYIFSIYNVFSFITNISKVLSEIYRVLKPGGKIMIMGQGKFNAISSKISISHSYGDDLDSVVYKNKVKWKDSVPILNMFSKESLERYLENAGFTVLRSYGIPIFTVPGSEDFTFPYKKMSEISKVLENKDFFNRVLEIEMKFNNIPSLVNRGMNIMSVGTKK